MRHSVGSLLALLMAVGFTFACSHDNTEVSEEAADSEWEVIQPEAQEAEWKFASLPWSLDDLRAAYTIGTKMTYDRSGLRRDGAEATGTHTLEIVDVNEVAGVVYIDSAWEDGGESATNNISAKWKDAVLPGSHPSSDDTVFEIVGKEQVETPAGTFDTVVVEVSNSFFESEGTYWLVVDQPGVYAKWVDLGKTDDDQDLVMTLREIARPE